MLGSFTLATIPNTRKKSFLSSLYFWKIFFHSVTIKYAQRRKLARYVRGNEEYEEFMVCNKLKLKRILSVIREQGGSAERTPNSYSPSRKLKLLSLQNATKVDCAGLHNVM